ncbi:gamma-aminobutyric acid type B receptor subunit 2 [Brachionus plicatilis]|uniref:Gamma-aminobutyric acid type B receptor subunit 2 n=1 Tax=Brachionus plicatilis TaxID=10195 RepID=A0A3M7SIC4_BRAPC|nr:gamma-aminobutyric acid type B receptor subunit 2 [Brachionus plicatilis]
MFVDLIILFVWQFSDSVKLRARYVYEVQSQPTRLFVPNRQTKNLTDSDPRNGENSAIRNLSHQTNQLKIVFECNSNLNEVWITMLTMYKIILLMYGIYLAWIIRNINVPSMNDSKYLLLSTYTIIICGLGSMTLMQLLKDWPDVVQAFFTIGIIISTCTTQCLLFIPKFKKQL